MKIIKPKIKNPGDHKEIAKEEIIDNIQFNIFKYNNRQKPVDGRDRLIISCFSEFGCETIGAIYCVPELAQRYPGKYKIVMGWYGREYLYRHSVDEFWELKEEHQWLRDYCRAFHHDSINLERIENKTANLGRVVTCEQMGKLVVGAKCWACRKVWGTTNYEKVCRYCGNPNIRQSLFGDVQNSKKKARRIPTPNKIEEAKKYLKSDKTVGVFARGRKCYGRNLQPEFYVKLISLLREMGYDVIWLGEKQNVQPCPVSDVVDFSQMEESRDLELTLSIISQLKFTVQFWTASTRLSSMVNVPYLLIESPDQIYGAGQEGFRRNLFDFSPSKLCMCHYLSMYGDNEAGLQLVRKSIEEMQQDNWDDVFGLLEDEKVARTMQQDNHTRVGGK